MRIFYAIYEMFLAFMLVAAVVICLVNGATLAKLREKGKTHYRAWLLPTVIANILAIVLVLSMLAHISLRIGSLNLEYLDFAVNAVEGLLGIYVAIRLWQSVNRAPMAPGKLPSDPEQDPGVWPPSPKPPDRG